MTSAGLGRYANTPSSSGYHLKIGGAHYWEENNKACTHLNAFVLKSRSNKDWSEMSTDSGSTNGFLRNDGMGIIKEWHTHTQGNKYNSTDLYYSPDSIEELQGCP